MASSVTMCRRMGDQAKPKWCLWVCCRRTNPRVDVCRSRGDTCTWGYGDAEEGVGQVTGCMVKQGITTMPMSSSRNVPATRAPFVFYVTIYRAMQAQVLPTSERLWGHVPTPKRLRCSRNVPPPPAPHGVKASTLSLYCPDLICGGNDSPLCTLSENTSYVLGQHVY